MKKYLIYLALLIPVLGNAQFEISYDPNTNTMSVNYTGCDICLLGTSGAVSICQCRMGCEIEPTAEELEHYEDCIDRCDQGYEGDPFYLDQCLDGCDRYLEGILEGIEAECSRNCGTEPEPIRTIIGYRYTLVAAWAPLGYDPRSDSSRWTRRPITPLITGNWVDIPDWNPESPWPEIYAGNNRCWGIGIRIFYEDPDGSRGFCDFTQWECEFIG